MPELIEVESYRRAAEALVGREVVAVDAPDPWFLKGGLTAEAVAASLVGATVTGTGRRGKLLWLELDGGGDRLGLRFGMTGRLVVDGVAAIEGLEYSSGRDDPSWDRFSLRTATGGARINDPRRLGGVEWNPVVDRLGPDAATVTAAAMRTVLDGGTAPVKARLLDQARLAGLGNLLADEILWRAGIDPARPVDELPVGAATGLARVTRSTVALLSGRGGSHTGDLQSQRIRGGVCPRCGVPLLRRTVGGRTTFSCPREQR